MISRFRIFASMVAAVVVCHVSFEASAALWFTAPELRVAAEDFRHFLGETAGQEVGEAILAPPETTFAVGDWVLANQSKKGSAPLGEALTAEQRGFLETGGQESFVAINRRGIRYLVGGGHRGATYASTRVQAAWLEAGKDPLAEESVPIQGSPAFRDRMGGAGGPHPGLDFAQPMPRDYEWGTYARALAHTGINLTPAVIQGRIVPDEALKPWGIRKVVFASAVPFSDSQLRKWRSANPSEIVASDNPRNRQTGSVGWSVCPSSAFGKRVYSDWLGTLLQDHKSTVQVVFFFSDWGSIPGEECLPGQTRAARIVEFLTTLAEIAKDLSPDLRICGSTRGLSVAELTEVVDECPARVGLYFEEPVRTVLDNPDTGFDPMMTAIDLDPEYQAILQAALSKRSSEVTLAVAAGDTDWSLSPAIGTAPPSATYQRLRSSKDGQVENIALAMGGFHPWTYSPSVEMWKEFVWNPQSSYEDLANRIAGRDFGSATKEILAAWDLFAEAFQRFPPISRAQRMEEFVTLGENLVTRALRPSTLGQDSWSLAAGNSVPYLTESLPGVIGLWTLGLAQIQAAQNLVGENDYDLAKRLRDAAFNANLFLRLLESQHNVVRCLNLLKWIPDSDEAEREPWKQAFAPVFRDELENCQAWQDLLFAAPQQEIRVERNVTTPGALSRRLEQKAAALSSFIGE